MCDAFPDWEDGPYDYLQRVFEERWNPTPDWWACRDYGGHSCDVAIWQNRMEVLRGIFRAWEYAVMYPEVVAAVGQWLVIRHRGDSREAEFVRKDEILLSRLTDVLPQIQKEIVAMRAKRAQGEKNDDRAG